MLGTIKKSTVFQLPRHVHAEYPELTQNILKVVHHERNFKDILNVPLGNILGPSFWFILGFTAWEHYDRTDGNITKEILNEPLGYFLDTFFGKIQGVPMVFLMGTLWSHDLEHCKCTGNFLTWGLGTF